MENDVCGYCGRANGWHAYACPNLNMHLSIPLAPHEPMDETVVIGPLASLPEVE